MEINLKTYLKCKLCNKTYEDPIILPCGKTLCSKHIYSETMGAIAKCSFCGQDHPITSAGFPKNEEISNLVRISDQYVHLDSTLGENNLRAKEMCNKYEQLITRCELLARDPDFFIYEYFNKIRSEIDLSKEKWIKMIDDHHSKLQNEIREAENKCKTNVNNNENFSKELDEIISFSREKLNLFLDASSKTDIINDNKWRTLQSKIRKSILITDKHINRFEHKLLNNKKYELKQNETLSDVNFGELCESNLNIEANDLDDEDDDDEESRAEATFQLIIDDFKEFKEKKERRFSTQPCIVRHLPWKILARSGQNLDFYLQCNTESESNTWSVSAEAELRLRHQTDPKKNFTMKIKHVFNEKENDWGFSPFITMKKIIDPSNGYYNVLNDSVTLEVHLKADKPKGFFTDLELYLVLEKDFYNNLGQADLYDHTKIEATEHLKVKKLSSVLDLMKQLSELLNLNVEDIRVWPIMNRYNSTVRPLNAIDLRELGHKTVQEVSKQDSTWTVFVETSGDLSFSPTFDYMSLFSLNQAPLHLESPAPTQKQQLHGFNSKEEVMLFFKYYDPKTSTLRYVFRMHLSISANLKQIQEKINKKMKFPPGTELLFFEEVKISQITPLTNRDISLEQLAHEQLLDGDIYVFQIDEKDKQAVAAYKLPTVSEYFRDLSLQLEITFCDKNIPNDEGFVLMLSLKMKYDEFAKLVGQHLKYDYQKLQFFRTSTYDLKASVTQAIKYNPEFQLRDAINMTNKQFVRKLYYQKLNIKISELDERRQFKCLWVSANLKQEKELSLMPHKKGSVKDLLNECRMELLREEIISQEQLNDEVNFRLRLLEVVGSKVYRILKEEMPIEQLDASGANKYYRVEQILPEELSIVNSSFSSNGCISDEYLLPVAHFSKEIYATFGSPFLLKIKHNEMFKEIKKRIQRRLDVSDKEFSTYRFAVITMGTANYLPEDDETQFDLSTSNCLQPWLGIDHTNKAANKTKSRYSTMEKAIKIFN